MAADTAASITAEGVSTALVDVSASAPVESGGSGPTLLHPLVAAIGRIGAQVGADAVLPELWCALPGWDLAQAWGRVLSAHEEYEVVVVDGGSFARTRDIIALPGVLLRLLDAALTPRTAMWRTGLDEGVFEELSAARQTVLGWRRILDGPDVSARLISRPEPEQAHRMLLAAAGLALQGVLVEGMGVSRYPRKKEHWPDHVRTAAQQALAVLETGAQGAQVWRSTTRRQATPRGVDVIGPWTDDCRAWRSQETIIEREGPDYAISIPLRAPAHSQARLGVTSRDLVIDLDGHLRWWELPPVLRRCRLVDAQQVEDGWRIRWSPDPDVWPRDGRADRGGSGA